MRKRTLRGSLGGTVMVAGLLAGLPGMAGAQAAPALPAATVPVPCSVPALIAAISGASSGDTLVLASNCTYTLTAVNMTADGALGLPLISNKILTLTGDDTSIERSTALGTPRFRIFEVAGSDSAGLILQGITLSNGQASGLSGLSSDGGCILVKFIAPLSPPGPLPLIPAMLELSHSAVQGCASHGIGAGGGIYLGSGATADIGRSSVDGNSSFTAGGGLFVASDAIARIIGGSVRENSAGAGGGIFVSPGGFVRLTGGAVQANTAVDGGGIFVAPDGTLVSDGSLLLDNVAAFRDIAAPKGLRLEAGGGLFNDGDARLTKGSVSGNHAAVDGGGIYTAGRLVIGATLLAENGAGVSGGGVFADDDASTHFAGDKFEFNVSHVSGGAIANEGDAFLQDSFVGMNFSPFGGGIWEGNFLGMAVTNSVIVNNTLNNCRPVNSVPLCVN